MTKSLKISLIIISILVLLAVFGLLIYGSMIAKTSLAVENKVQSNPGSPEQQCAVAVNAFIDSHGYKISGMNFVPKAFYNKKLSICFLEVELDKNQLYNYDFFDLTNNLHIASYVGQGDGDVGEEPQTKNCIVHGTQDFSCKDRREYLSIINKLLQ